MSDSEPPVWPDFELYQLLALVDAIRDGRAREREIAKKDIKIRLKHYG